MMPELITPERARELLNGGTHWIDLDETLNAALHSILELAGTIDSLNYQIRVRDRRLSDARDLPEANDPSAGFVPDGKGWLLTDATGPVVWTAPGGLVVIQRIEPGELTPVEAREFASHIIAAAAYAETGE